MGGTSMSLSFLIYKIPTSTKEYHNENDVMSDILDLPQSEKT